MTQRTPRRQTLGAIGIGATACLACCAGPILAILGGLSVAGLASAGFIGAAGIAIALAAMAAFIVVRRRRRLICEPNEGTIPVEVTSRR